MSKSIHPIEQEELMAYLDGELEADRATAAAAHLNQCRECQKLADDLREVSQKLMVWHVAPADPEMTPELVSALQENASEKDAPTHKNTDRRRKSWREILTTPQYWVGAFVSAAFILAVAAISILSLMKSKPSARESSVELPQRQLTVDNAEQQVGTNEGTGRTRGFAGYVDIANGSTSFAYTPKTSAPPLSETMSRLAPSPTPAPQPRQDRRHDPVVPAGPMIVRTVELVLITPEFDKARKSVEDTVKRHHGYFGNLTTGGAADAGRTLDAILRVPAEDLDSTLPELKNLGRVESESQKGDEVSQQYVDLQARLTNARNTEQRLTDLLRERTGRLSDVLEVEQQIDSVRERIEQMDAEKKNLANQVAFATLTMKMREDYKAHVQMVPPSTSSRIRNAAVDGYETMVAGLINIALFLASWGPSLLLWALILFFPIRGLWRKVRQARATENI